jgi:histidine triad (HIT) family protein
LAVSLKKRRAETIERDEGAVTYDPNNIFARILRGELPCKKIYEDEHVVAFPDINPRTPTHVLVVPKGAYVSFDDFSAKAGDAELLGFFRAVGLIARQLGLAEPGYRMLANIGHDGLQEVPHFHVHLLGGRRLGWI